MKHFRLVDNVVGWLTFFIAAFVYCSTIEPTASFWDCPEFITTGYKLEVGHPPGAPFFMLTANLFSQFTSDPTQVARMVNMMSALLSAACILFLFWSITHLVRRLLTQAPSGAEGGSLWKLIAIEASGLVGALIYTFSDTFWFSAVEGEVYAYSSAFTAVVFWLILKWEEHADEPHADRWLVLIMYMTGLSIGVHLLNLLCLPAIVLVWYFKRFPKANAKGAFVALLVSFAILAAVLYGVVPGIITVGGWFELFFVNTLGMPFNTGLIIYLILLVGSVIWAIYETQNATEKNWRRQNIAFLLGFGLLGIPFYGYGWSAFFIGVVVLALVGWALFWRRGEGKNAVALISARVKNTTLLCMLMLMIGYSTYAVIVIRSAANPPMDQNSPEDIFTLGSYLSRDQYGYRPLLWGQGFDSELAEDEETGDYAFVSDGPTWHKTEKHSVDEPDSYYAVKSNINGRERDVKGKYLYAENMFFPRMYSSAHASFYKTWNGGITGKTVQAKYPNRYPYRKEVTMPTFWDNMRFFLSYQCGYMYWRYFLWNFAGRQNDIQGLYGEREHGNALTGFGFIDKLFLGDQSLLSDDLKNNKGHNVFYCMPLLLGLIGLFWQLMGRGRKGLQQFWVVFFLFFMTGLAIVVYLNQTPLQPRERDYAYAGSFYAYAIWCGIGVAAIISWLNNLLSKKLKAQTMSVALAAIVGLVCLIVPLQMASQTWDDHDRSGRYTCRDFGQNYLMTLQDKGNPIIFTNGDNDTFPLWYNMDTEGVRTDARVCNLSYLQTDWYIDQMVRPAYESPSLPISWKKYQYCDGTNDFIMIDPNAKYAIKLIQEASPEEAKQVFGDDPFELKNILKYWVRDERTKEQKDLQRDYLNWAYSAMEIPDQYRIKESLDFIPTDTVYINIDKEAVLRSGMLIQGDSLVTHEDSLAAIPDRMSISLASLGGVDKSKLMMLEMLANANWERPLYVAMTVGQDNYMNLGNHFVQEGLAYRITPFTTNVDNRPVPGITSFDTEKTYDNVMNRFKYGGVSTKGVYLDETVTRMCLTHRMLLVDLANHLMDEGQNDKALKVLERLDKELPAYNVPYDMDSRELEGRRLGYQDGKTAIYSSGSSYREALLYVELGQEEKARPILDYFWKRANQMLTFYLSLNQHSFHIEEISCLKQLNVMLSVIRAYFSFDEAKATELNNQLQQRCAQFELKGGNLDAAHWD